MEGCRTPAANGSVDDDRTAPLSPISGVGKLQALTGCGSNLSTLGKEGD